MSTGLRKLAIAAIEEAFHDNVKTCASGIWARASGDESVNEAMGDFSRYIALIAEIHNKQIEAVSRVFADE